MVLSLQASLRNLLAAARSIRRFCSLSSALCFAMRSVGGVGMGRASGTETDATFSSALPTRLRLSFVWIIKLLTPAPSGRSSVSCGKSGSGSEILLV